MDIQILVVLHLSILHLFHYTSHCVHVESAYVPIAWF